MLRDAFVVAVAAVVAAAAVVGRALAVAVAAAVVVRDYAQGSVQHRSFSASFPSGSVPSTVGA